MATTKQQRRLKIKTRIGSKMIGSNQKPRLSVFRSNTRIYAQIIDDLNGTTLVSASSLELGETKGINVTVSHEVGKKLAEKAVANGINNVVFDRNGYLYHGKVKALAEGAREGGLKF
jgi:large subunit ribosomal protein L18